MARAADDQLGEGPSNDLRVQAVLREMHAFGLHSEGQIHSRADDQRVSMLGCHLPEGFQSVAPDR